MEKSATDPSITNVLLLIDSVYAKKADQRKGGVGTETQIISSEVYNQIDQSKFIPVIFARDSDGNISKPRYLKGLLHFDLTCSENYDSEYQRLVRRLYGIESNKEPELSKPPAWLTEEPSVLLKSKISSEFYKGNTSDIIKSKKFRETITDITNQIFEYTYENEDNYIDEYLELKHFRDEILLLLKNSEYVLDGYKYIISSLEDLEDEIRNNHREDISLKRTLIHELFIYIISYYIKQNDVEALRYILNKTYFIAKSNFNEEEDSYNSFYYNNQKLDVAVCKRDDERYHCGTAALWMELINVDICNKNEFVLGDLLCYNFSYLIENYEKNWAWFPITYIYSGIDYGSLLKKFAVRMKSKEQLEIFSYILGFKSLGDFIKKYTEIEELYKKGSFRDYRYNSSFDSAENFWDYISNTELGKKN